MITPEKMQALKEMLTWLPSVHDEWRVLPRRCEPTPATATKREGECSIREQDSTTLPNMTNGFFQDLFVHGWVLY